VDIKVADCLSHYYENSMGDESHLEHIYMNSYARLEPDNELLPTDRDMELKTAATIQSNHHIKKREAWILESEEMNNGAQRALLEFAPPSLDDEDITVTAASSDGTTLRTKVENSMDLSRLVYKGLMANVSKRRHPC
jgi:hypothetical protein